MPLVRYGNSIEPNDAQLLGESIHMPFSGRAAKSRFLKSAMSERMASWDQHDLAKRGILSDLLIGLYEAWGKAGYGIILTGNVMLYPEQLETPGNPILYAPHETPKRVEQFRRMAAAGKANGSLMIMQISHPGRQVAAVVNPDPVGASDIQREAYMGVAFGKPTPLDQEGIRSIVSQFGYAAETAYRTGFDGIQLHGAYGYLIAQFLSPATNNRTDEYGGSIANRARIIREITEEIRARVKDRSFVIGIKINSIEFQAKGFQPEEAAELCQELEAMEIDFVELSGGGFRHSDVNPFAEKITPRLTKTVVYVTGGFRSAAGMADAIRSGACAGIGLGCPAGSDPLLPAEIIGGTVTGATESKLPPQNFGIHLVATGTQMRSIAEGKPAFDLSDVKDLSRFMEVAQDHQTRMAESFKSGVLDPRYPTLDIALKL